MSLKNPGSNESTQPEIPEISDVRRVAALRRGLATRQAARRAAERRELSRRSKVAVASLPFMLLGTVAVAGAAFANNGSSAKSDTAGSAASTGAALGGELASFDSRPRPLGGDWANAAAAPAAPATTTPPTTAAAGAPRAPATTGSAVVVSPQGRSLGSFVVTCYDLSGRTASGASTSSETVAVDPRVIPLGSRIYIQGVGERVAQDTGGAIVGRRLDIWEPSYAQCAAWGVESRQVWLG